MVDWLAGGAIGAVVAALGMGLLLWRERDKRSKAEQASAAANIARASAERENERLKGREAVLARLVAQREARIATLEAQLATVNPGRLLDDVFGGVPEDPAAGSTGSEG